MKKAIIGTMVSMVLGGASLGALAAPCQVSDVKVTTISQYSGLNAGATLNPISSASISAAECAGAFDGNDMPKPTKNLGYADDGLLNGADQSSPSGPSLFPGGAFVTEADKTDLRGDGTANDPGWIMLGRLGFDEEKPGSFTPESIGGDASIVLSSFFTVTSTGAGTGTWAFTPDAEVAQRAFDVLGKNYFDQFVLIFKAGPNFAVYDFKSHQFGIENPSAEEPIYTFAGTYDLSNTLVNTNKNGKINPAGISHVSLWARDPGGDNVVPEPGSLALLGVSLFGLGVVRRYRVKS